ncbi:MAG: hypothetical protein ACOVQR_12070 [Flavobacterium sp.]|jgi:hypothetical protein|uniref:hypothetical protein n=1 Tax=Flavobacterium sp. TaxID=239 RepID=UPI003BA4F964
MNLTAQKSELIKWINSIEDVTILKKIEVIKSETSFDFEKEWARSISGDELRERTKKHLKSLPWKK